MGASSAIAVAEFEAGSPELGPSDSEEVRTPAPTLSIAPKPAEPPSPAEAQPRESGHAARLLGLQAIVLGQDRLLEAATALATELATEFSCERVSLGFAERGGVISVAAMSHTAQFDPRSQVIRDLGAMMDEAAEQAISVTVPAIELEAPCIALLHAELVRRQGGAVCTVPLVGDGTIYGAITLERSGAAFTQAEVSLCEHVASFLGPVLQLKRNYEHAWSTRCARALRAARPYIVGQGHWGAKLAIWGVILAVAAALTLPAPYRLSAPARLEGSIQRALVAPSDGFLRRAHVRPGDLVKAEQLLAEFADQDLLLERRKWESAVAQHENGYGAALARADRSQLMILRSKADEARAQLGLVEQQLARMRLTAPFDGVIIKGDLRQSLGAPVQRGEVLLTLAPSAEFRLILEVDERDVGRIRTGQKGTLVLASMSDRTWPFVVERLTPVAVTRDGRNLFEIESKLATVSSALQPGLEGVAKIEMGDETLAWILTHRLFDWLRVTLWTWGL